MKTIKLFIAGAKNLKEQRLSLKALCNDLNAKYSREGRNVSINMCSYENFGDQQTSYDDYIQNEADMVVFIIDGRLGSKTEAELRHATEAFEKNDKPEIITFVRAFTERTKEIDYLENVVNSISDKYYVDYTNTEDLIAKANERIDSFVKKQISSKIEVHTYKLTKVTIGLFLLCGLVMGSALLYRELSPKSELNIQVEELPVSLYDAGITTDFVEQQVKEFLPSLKDDANKKLNDILGDIADVVPPVSNENSVIDRLAETQLSDICIVSHHSAILQKFRKAIGKKDLNVRLKILETDSLFVSKVTMEDWNNECRSKTIEERKSSYSNAIKCAICLFKKNIAFIASAYSPAASSLYDYEPREGLGEYELENPWKENLYNHEDRNELVKRGASIAYPDSNYCKLILANYNERIGILTMDTILLNKACFYYNSFCVSDSTNAIKIREHVRLLKEYCLDAQRKNEHLPVPQLLIKKGLIPSGNKCRQLIVVHNQEIVRDKEKNYYKATLQAFEKKGEMWIEVISPIKANLGINGIALPGQKREGDLMTPSGYYALPYVFGYKKDVETKMDFLIVNRDHVWVCDTSSKQYNQLIEDVSDTFKDNSKNERLLRFDHLNKYAIVIDYNTKPVVKGKGSAIFIHVERASFHKTAGCISIPEESIVDLIRWLDPSMFPHIYITKKIDSKENGR